MNKYKIVVYAISKNEEKFVDRWHSSMKEADEIYVLDTGSTDKTVEKLKNLGVHVKSEIFNPWRFDVARNESLNMIPEDTDICVCTDLDEVFNKGWRNELEKVWKKDTKQLKYIYNWSLDENNKPIISFYYEKIHSKKYYKWVYPVHEVLKYSGENLKYEISNNIILNHYPDKNKSRNSYLPLLELSIKEDPYNDRNMHYLGREYMYHGKYNECIDTLIKHLNLKSSTWKHERCASMRFIARSYKFLKRFDESKMWLEKAINEASDLRDPLIETAILEYELNNFNNVIKYCNKALKIKINNRTYINEVFSFDNTVYDLLSIAYYYIGNYKKSLLYINKAIEMNPKDIRLLNNKILIKNKIKEISN